MARMKKVAVVEPVLGEKGANVPPEQKKPSKALKTAKKRDGKNGSKATEVSQKISQGVKKSKKQNFGDKAHTFTDEDRKKGNIRWKQIAEMRRKLQAEFVQAAVEGRLGEKYLKAVETEDKELIDLCEKAAKMIGTHFDQTKDALGGENNPMNVKNAVSVAPSPENVKKINDMLEGCC